MKELLERVEEVLTEAHLKREDYQDVDRRLQVISDVKKAIQLLDTQAIGQIEIDGFLGAPYLAPRWYSGMMPKLGTKLYLNPVYDSDNLTSEELDVDKQPLSISEINRILEGYEDRVCITRIIESIHGIGV